MAIQRIDPGVRFSQAVVHGDIYSPVKRADYLRLQAAEALYYRMFDVFVLATMPPPASTSRPATSSRRSTPISRPRGATSRGSSA